MARRIRRCSRVAVPANTIVVSSVSVSRSAFSALPNSSPTIACPSRTTIRQAAITVDRTGGSPSPDDPRQDLDKHTRSAVFIARIAEFFKWQPSHLVAIDPAGAAAGPPGAGSRFLNGLHRSERAAFSRPWDGGADHSKISDWLLARISHQGQPRHRAGRSPIRQEKAAERSLGHGQGLRRRARPARRDP